MTVAEYAKEQGVSTKRIYQRIHAGKVKANVHRVGKYKKYEIVASGNGNGTAAYSIDDVAQAMPSITVRKALQVLQILNG